MSIMLNDKIEAVWELKRFVHRKVARSDERTHGLLQSLLRAVMNENLKNARHEIQAQFPKSLRDAILDQCPTVARWVAE